MSHVGKRIVLDSKTKEKESGFPTVVKRFTDDKQLWRKIELKIEH